MQNTKELFLNDIELQIGEYLTGAHTKRVIEDLDTELAAYTLESINTDYSPCNDDIIQAYLNAKTVEGKSPKTIARYSYILEKAFQTMGTPAARATTEDLRAYFTHEKDRGLSNRSLEAVRQVMSAFYGWVSREGYVRRNPMGNIGAIKYKKKIRKPFSALEIDELKSSCRDCRDLALVHFLLSTGCRIDEVHNMNIEDVNFEELEVKVLGKGNKERIVYMDPVAAVAVRTYLAERDDEDPALFVGQRGRITTQGFRAILKRIEHRSGVENVHPHRFRRTLATRLIDRGMPIQDVAKILGHANINTTTAYIYSDKENVKHAYQRYI